MTIWLYIILTITILNGIGLVTRSCEREEWMGNFVLCLCGFVILFHSYGYKGLVRTAVIVMLCIDALLLFMIWCRKMRTSDAVIARLQNSIKAIKMIAIPIFLFLSIFVYVGTKKSEKATVEITQKVETYGDEYSFDSNVDTMLNLQEDVWKTLSPEKRLEVLQCVAHCEARYLGIWTPLTVKVEEMSDNLGGFYRDSDYTIHINRDAFLNKTGRELVEIICHESYHAYSFRLVDLYLNADEKEQQLMVFNKVKTYADEFENYVGSEKDLYEYYQQKCEKDAYVYGVSAMEDYFEKIDKSLNKEE